MSPRVKRQKDKFKLPPKFWLLGLTVLSVLLMFFTFLTDFRFNTGNVIVGYTMVPFQKGITTISSYFKDRSDLLVSIKELESQNRELKKQVDDLTIDNAILQQEKFELNNLRTLYELDSKYPEFEKTGARIIMGSTSNWFDSFIIDKGEEDGIKVDMNVMAGSGLVGRVVEVGPNWSQVTSVIDDSSNVSGTVLSTSDHLIVSGDLQTMKDGYIRFSQLMDPENQVSLGDKVVTSNISDRYLPGILVGYISYIEDDSNNMTKSGYISPVVDFEHLSEVLVIMEQKETISK